MTLTLPTKTRRSERLCISCTTGRFRVQGRNQSPANRGRPQDLADFSARSHLPGGGAARRFRSEKLLPGKTGDAIEMRRTKQNRNRQPTKIGSTQ